MRGTIQISQTYTDSTSIIEQPLKLPFLAGAIVVLNITKSDLAGKIISDVTAAAQNSLGAGSWRDFKLQLRLLACLQLLLTDDGLFPFLNELFETAVLLQSSSEDDVRRSFRSVPALRY